MNKLPEGVTPLDSMPLPPPITRNRMLDFYKIQYFSVFKK